MMEVVSVVAPLTLFAKSATKAFKHKNYPKYNKSKFPQTDCYYIYCKISQWNSYEFSN